MKRLPNSEEPPPEASQVEELGAEEQPVANNPIFVPRRPDGSPPPAPQPEDQD